jgi:signal transduction histidine kinase
MIIGLLVCSIGLIPLVLAFSVNRIYKDSNLSIGLLIYMILISIWQGDIGILYFKNLLNEQNVLWLFRLLRIAPTFAIPAVFYIAYVIIENSSTTFKNRNILNKILKFVFTKKILFLLVGWSSFIYIINWTGLGIKGLKIENASSMSFYFPEYGIFSWLYTIHMSSFILFLLFVLIISREILYTSMKLFLRAFSLYSILLFITGFLNFSPATGLVMSSIGVIIFSTMIMLEFVKLNRITSLNYYQLLERQKKLDYTGNLAGSLIHEVKNTNLIIKGFSNILTKSGSLNDTEKGSLEMILKATEQLESLSNNYREYMKNSTMDFKVEDLEQIIDQSIKFSKAILKEKDIDIEFTNNYNPLKAFVNKTYFHQVFINLIKNSSEAMPAETKIRKITIKTELEEDQVIIHFCDTGKGIPPENWESIFDPFISFKSKGMGLGLPFVKKIIFEHLGNIRIIDSTPSGTHFQITIPQYGIYERN